MEATIEAIKNLREKTGAGVGAVKEALVNSTDINEAIRYLRQKGVAKAAKRAGKEASEGTLGIYRHGDSKLVVIVSVATETDFAAKSEAVVKFANDLALHVAALNTEFINIDSVPTDLVAEEKLIAQKDLDDKPKDIADKIVEGRMNKFFDQCVLMNQKLFSDDSKTVQDYLNEIVAKVGEKIQINSFVKIKVGEDAYISRVNS